VAPAVGQCAGSRRRRPFLKAHSVKTKAEQIFASMTAAGRTRDVAVRACLRIAEPAQATWLAQSKLNDAVIGAILRNTSLKSDTDVMGALRNAVEVQAMLDLFADGGLLPRRRFDIRAFVTRDEHGHETVTSLDEVRKLLDEMTRLNAKSKHRAK
jgi:hypothetical protein